MNDRASQLITTALDQLAAALAAGHSTSLTAVLKTMARFHRYSWTNQLLISMQRPEATRVAGFRTWLTLGRAVRRGEKGIAILAPMMRRDRSLDDVDEHLPRVVGGFRTVFVFDVAQTDGEALPDFARPVGDPGSAIETLESFLSSRGIRCARASRRSAVRRAHWGRATADASRSETTWLQRRPSPRLLHEAAHELLHRDPVVGRLTHTVRELEADAVACVVAEALGIEALDASRDYIHLHQGSAELLAEPRRSVVRRRRLRSRRRSSGSRGSLAMPGLHCSRRVSNSVRSNRFIGRSPTYCRTAP